MPSPRRNLALLRITKFVTIRTPGLAVYFASLSTTSFHMGTPYKIQKIPRTPGCNNGPPVQGISRFYLMAIPHNSKCRYGERGAADAVPQPPERCLSRQAGIVRYCPYACAWFNPAQNSAPNVAAITALMVCIRFSASWNTMDCGPVNTSSVTSMASRPNFSPISLPTAVLWSW